MATLEEIRYPVAHDLAQFEQYFRDSLSSHDPYIHRVIQIIVGQRGKQMRPLLTLLVAALNGTPTEHSHAAAAVLELIHTASLVHDDVIDEAFHRRGEFSIKALFRNKKSVLIGDYILAQSMIKMVDISDMRILKAIAACVQDLCSGELLQMEHSSRLDTDEQTYYDIILKKTGVLLGACGAVGALSVGANDETTARMRRFGELLGLAFQIKDDILDYAQTSITGKFACNDIYEQKITLPMIYLLDQSDATERKRLLRMLSHVRTRPENALALRSAVEDSGGLDYAARRMTEQRDHALELLTDYPDSPVKQALTEYADFVLSRKK